MFTTLWSNIKIDSNSYPLLYSIYFYIFAYICIDFWKEIKRMQNFAHLYNIYALLLMSQKKYKP